MKRRTNATVPPEISDFYYWLCENASTACANDFLDDYLAFKEDGETK